MILRILIMPLLGAGEVGVSYFFPKGVYAEVNLTITIRIRTRLSFFFSFRAAIDMPNPRVRTEAKARNKSPFFTPPARLSFILLLPVTLECMH